MTKPCKYGDPNCPCQDGDPCHYEDHGGPKGLTRPYELEIVEAMCRAWCDANGPAAVPWDIMDPDCKAANRRAMLAALRVLKPIANHAQGIKAGSQSHVALWDAINSLVIASGGRNNISTARMNAVAGVESALRACLPNTSDQRTQDELGTWHETMYRCGAVRFEFEPHSTHGNNQTDGR